VADSKDVSLPAAVIAIVSASLAIVALATLHVVSPEFSPAWRMISEYGNGHYEWILSLMFAFWGLSALALAYAIRSQARGAVGRTGLALLVVAGVGDIGGGVFDINHDPGHSIAGALGIVGLPAAAVLVSIALGRNEQWAAAKRLVVLTAHLTWVSLVLLGITFVLMVVTFMQVQGSLPTEVPRSIPAGVVALVGWTNRLLMLAYSAWVIVVAWQAIKIRSQKTVAARRTLAV
jgi:hypothetical membrane protein